MLSRHGTITVDVVLVPASKEVINPLPAYAGFSHLLALLITNTSDGGPMVNPEDCFVPFKGTFEGSPIDGVAGEGACACPPPPRSLQAHRPSSALAVCISAAQPLSSSPPSSLSTAAFPLHSSQQQFSRPL
jgi:hypothetical protein